MGIYLENARCHISGDLLESLVKKKDLPIDRKSSDVFSIFYSLINLKDKLYIEKVIHFNHYYFRKKSLIEWIHLCIKNNGSTHKARYPSCYIVQSNWYHYR